MQFTCEEKKGGEGDHWVCVCVRLHTFINSEWGGLTAVWSNVDPHAITLRYSEFHCLISDSSPHWERGWLTVSECVMEPERGCEHYLIRALRYYHGRWKSLAHCQSWFAAHRVVKQLRYFNFEHRHPCVNIDVESFTRAVGWETHSWLTAYKK